MSTNPWKIAATFTSVTSTREQYVAKIDDLKESVPEESKDVRRSKSETQQLALAKALEDRIETIDAELAVSTNYLHSYFDHTDGPAYRPLRLLWLLHSDRTPPPSMCYSTDLPRSALRESARRLKLGSF